MKVSDLIIALQDHDPNNTVIFDDGFGNSFTLDSVQKKQKKPVTVVFLAPSDTLA